MKPGWTSIVEMIELHKIIGKIFAITNLQSLFCWFDQSKPASFFSRSKTLKYFPLHHEIFLAGIRWNISSSVQCTICDPILESSPKLYLAHLNLFHFLSSDEIYIKCKTWFKYLLIRKMINFSRMFWFESISLAPV